MRIPDSSAILIKGIQPASLTYAAALSKLGAKVLMIDEKASLSNQEEYLAIDEYSTQLSKNLGFVFKADEIANGIKTTDFIQQALTFLAQNLCSVIWNTAIKSNFNNNAFILLHNHQETEHQTQYLIDAGNLENKTLDFRIAFINAWKYAGVVNKTLHPQILTSLSIEESLLTEQFKIGLKPKKSSFFNNLFKSSKAGLNLIESKVSLHLSQNRRLEAGEILPDYSFFDEKLKAQSSLYQWSNYHHFSVIIFGYLLPTNLFIIAKWIQLNYPVQLFYLPQSKNNTAIFEKLNIRDGEKKSLIVRPDRYIGLLHDGIDIDLMDNYLSNFIFMREKTTLINS